MAKSGGECRLDVQHESLVLCIFGLEGQRTTEKA